MSRLRHEQEPDPRHIMFLFPNGSTRARLPGAMAYGQRVFVSDQLGWPSGQFRPGGSGEGLVGRFRIHQSGSLGDWNGLLWMGIKISARSNSCPIGAFPDIPERRKSLLPIGIGSPRTTSWKRLLERRVFNTISFGCNIDEGTDVPVDATGLIPVKTVATGTRSSVIGVRKRYEFDTLIRGSGDLGDVGVATRALSSGWELGKERRSAQCAQVREDR